MDNHPIKPNMESISSLIGINENSKLEFKTCSIENGKMEKENRMQILKEIAAFANAEGGQIILGISEKDGIASEITGTGCTEDDFDNFQLSLQNTISAKIRPHIYGLTIELVKIRDNVTVIIINVLMSFIKPHAVFDGNKDNFYIRHSNGVAFMSVNDLRNQFLYTASYKKDIQDFIRERKSMILCNEISENLAEGAKLALHVIPAISLDYRYSINIKIIKDIIMTDVGQIIDTRYVSTFLSPFIKIFSINFSPDLILLPLPVSTA